MISTQKHMQEKKISFSSFATYKGRATPFEALSCRNSIPSPFLCKNEAQPSLAGQLCPLYFWKLLFLRLVGRRLNHFLATCAGASS